MRSRASSCRRQRRRHRRPGGQGRRLGPAPRRPRESEGRASPVSKKSTASRSSDAGRITHGAGSNRNRQARSSATFPSPGRAWTRRASASRARAWRPTRPRCAPTCAARASRPRASGSSRSALQGRRQGQARRHRGVQPPARHHAGRGHSAGAGVRDRRQRPRQAVDAEADPRHQGRRRGRHLAARGARASIRCISTTCS